MNTTITAASFALITTLATFSTVHAVGFNDQSYIPNAAVSVATGRQDLRHIPMVQGFNEQSYISAAALESTPRTGSAPIITGGQCELASQAGFENSTSFAASC
jgi:hypothetical protein